MHKYATFDGVRHVNFALVYPTLPVRTRSSLWSDRLTKFGVLPEACKYTLWSDSEKTVSACSRGRKSVWVPDVVYSEHVQPFETTPPTRSDNSGIPGNSESPAPASMHSEAAASSSTAAASSSAATEDSTNSTVCPQIFECVVCFDDSQDIPSLDFIACARCTAKVCVGCVSKMIDTPADPSAFNSTNPSITTRQCPVCRKDHDIGDVLRPMVAKSSAPATPVDALRFLERVADTRALFAIARSGFDDLAMPNVDVVSDLWSERGRIGKMYNELIAPQLAKGSVVMVLSLLKDSPYTSRHNRQAAVRKNARFNIERAWDPAFPHAFFVDGDGRLRSLARDSVWTIANAHVRSMCETFARVNSGRVPVRYHRVDCDLLTVHASDLGAALRLRETSAWSAAVRARFGGEVCALKILNRVSWCMLEHWTDARVYDVGGGGLRRLTRDEWRAVVGTGSGLFGDDEDARRRFVLINPAAGREFGPGRVRIPGVTTLGRDASVESILKAVWEMRSVDHPGYAEWEGVHVVVGWSAVSRVLEVRYA